MDANGAKRQSVGTYRNQGRIAVPVVRSLAVGRRQCLRRPTRRNPIFAGYLRRPGIAVLTAFSPVFRAAGEHLRFFHPAMKVAGDLAHEDLTAFLQTVEKGATATVEFVERPGTHEDPIGQSPVDLCQSNLGFGLKDDVVGDEVFFRRPGSLA